MDLIDADAAVSAQLATTACAAFPLPDGRTVTLTSGWIPPIDPGWSLCLDGVWACRRGRVLGQAAVLSAGSTAGWEAVPQPGVVCRADPSVQPADIPGWNRRFMSHVAEDDGAVLRRRVGVPAAWAGRRIWLRLDGVYPACDVYVAGRLLAQHRSGLTACAVDCSDLAVPGSDLDVAVVLVRRYAGQEIDMPRHSSDYAGMHGSAWLIALPPAQVTGHDLAACLDDDLRSARLAGSVELVNHGADTAGDLEVRLLDGGQTVAVQRLACRCPTGSSRVAVDLAVPTPRLWHAEHPHLYRVELHWRCGGHEQSLAWRCGFRRLAVVDGRPQCNGTPLKLRGVNHLSLHPEHGLHTPEAWLRRCLDLMRKANVNAIRTHLTAPSVLADLCDELGFFLIQEVTIDWFGHELENPTCLGPCLHRIDATLRRDRHHPSLVMVGIGNENLPANPQVIDAFRRHYQAFHRLAKTLAPDLWVCYPPPGPANAIPGDIEPRIGDIADVHYNLASVRTLRTTGAVVLPKSWQGPFRSYTHAELRAFGWSGAWFSSEYGIVNAVADVHDAPWQSVICEEPADWLGPQASTTVLAERLEREWGLMRDDPTCLGGAYFPWLPPGVGEPWGWTLWAEDADWGVVTQDLTPKPQFWVLRAALSPVTVAERRVHVPAAATAVTLTLRNRYGTIDLADCTLRTQLGATGKLCGILRDWRDIEVAGAPGADVQVEIPLWHDQARASLAEGRPVVLRLHILAPDGTRPLTHEVLLIPGLLAAGAGSGHISLGSDA
jgi:hypothetical protein